MAIQAQLYPDNFGFGGGGGPEDLLMESGYGGSDHLGFVPQRQQQFDHNSSHDQKNLNFLVENNNIIHHQQQQSMTFSHSDKQRVEFEHFINLQNERLRLAIHHQRKQQTLMLFKKYESKAQILLSRKEEEIARAANRTTELHGLLKKLEIENLTWQKIAKENESMVTSLDGTIRRLRESASLSASAADDAESCCQNGEDDKEAGVGNAICKRCKSRKSCVVLLPCRHLCSCKECDAFLHTCLVCKMVKKGSIEALI